MKSILVALLLLFPVVSHAAENSNGGIIYGKDNAFLLTAPAGWVLDNQSGVSQGVHAVFYPKGGSWKESTTVMYAKAVAKESDKQTFQQFIDWDVDYFKKNEPTIVVEDIVLKILPGKTVAAKKMNYGINKEVIVYINEPKTVTEIVMTARDEDSFNQSFGAFKELVESYKFLGTKVEMK